MKKLLSAILAIAVLAAWLAFPAPAEDHRRLTLMVYMCGSNLESGYGSASADIQEMLASGFDAHQVTVLVMAGGTAEWNLAFDPAQTSVTEITPRGMRIVWRSDAMNMGEPETLTRLLAFGQENYPANDYALILWDHGGGPLEGVCWDELFSMDNLSLNELTGAIEAANLPKKLSFIGFDACLMSSVEVASALSPYGDYMIASQETEPAKGWNYAFLADIADDLSAAETGRRIVDSYFEALADSNDILTMACVDLAKVAAVAERMDDYFTPMAGRLDSAAFAQLSGMRLSSTGFGKAVRGVGEEGYDLVDLGDLVSRLGGENTELEAALSEAVVYSRSSEPGAGGLSVYHPFANKRKYAEAWADNYRALNFCPGYSEYMARFGALLTGDEMTDWSGLVTNDEGFGANDENLFSLQLTPEQLEGFASAQLMVLATGLGDTAYYPVSVADVSIDENGLLTSDYRGSALYVANADGVPICGPVSFLLSDDGATFSVLTYYQDYSGLKDSRPRTPVLYRCAPSADDPNRLEILGTYVWDDALETYTNRIGFDPEGFTELDFYLFLRHVPEESGGVLPGFDAWENYGGYQLKFIKLPVDWHLQFFDEQLSGSSLYATFQVTDVQQNTYSSPLIPLRNPHVKSIAITPESVEVGGVRLTFEAAATAAALTRNVTLTVRAENVGDEKVSIRSGKFIVNGSRSTERSFLSDMLEPGETDEGVVYFYADDLTGIDEITALSCEWAVLDEDYNDSDPIAVSLDVENCDTRGIGSPVASPLAEVSADGVTWQVVQLTRDSEDQFVGTLHVINDTDAPYEGNPKILFNGVMCDSSCYVNVAPHTDTYAAFTMEDRTTVSRYSVDVSGSDSKLYLVSIDHVLERAGFDALESVEVLLGMSDYSDEHMTHVPMTFGAPLPIQADDYAAEGFASTPLLTGDVSADVCGVLVGDHAIGFTLVLRNDTDRDETLVFYAPTVNGVDVGGSLGTSKTLTVPAHVTRTEKLVFDIRTDDMPEDPMERFGIMIRVDDYPMGQAVVTFETPAVFGTDGGAYYPGSALEIDPVRLAAPEELPLFIRTKAALPDAADVHPFEVIAPATEEQKARFDHGTAWLVERRPETVTLESGETVEIMSTRPVLSVPVEWLEDGRLAAKFPGVVATINGEIPFAMSGTRATDGGLTLTSFTSLFAFDDPEACYPRPEESILMSWEYLMNVSIEIDARATDDAFEVLALRTGGVSPQTEYTNRSVLALYEVAAAMAESRVYYDDLPDLDTSDYEYWEDLPVPADEPLTLTFVPVESLSGTYAIQFSLYYPDETREVILVDMD